MIKLTKMEAEYVLFALAEVQMCLSAGSHDIWELEEPVDAAEEIMRACICNSALDEVIPDV